MSNEEGVETLLIKWEEVYKKGLLSLWLLLILHGKSSYAYEVSRELEKFSEGSLSADENSIYRALGRFESMGILRSELVDSETGPNRRYYSLTEKGEELLRRFIRRNILVFDKAAVKSRIAAATK